jgi:hypothetical protein
LSASVLVTDQGDRDARLPDCRWKGICSTSRPLASATYRLLASATWPRTANVIIASGLFTLTSATSRLLTSATLIPASGLLIFTASLAVISRPGFFRDLGPGQKSLKKFLVLIRIIFEKLSVIVLSFDLLPTGVVSVLASKLLTAARRLNTTEAGFNRRKLGLRHTATNEF